MLKIVNPKFNKTEWSGPLGQHIAREILIISGYKSPIKPIRKCNMEPDFETEECVWEIKNGTYLTSGTAHEKIFGVPIKYAEVPIIYKKPLVILCLGKTDDVLSHYNLDNTNIELENTNRWKCIEFFKKMDISFTSARSLLNIL